MVNTTYEAPVADVVYFSDSDLLRLSFGDGEGDPIDIDW